MTNDPSGGHALPPATPPESRGLVVEVKHIVAVAAFLGFGGVGAGVVTIGSAHSPVVQAAPEVVSALAEIKAQLLVMNAKLDTTSGRIDDHEARLRALEHPVKVR